MAPLLPVVLLAGCESEEEVALAMEQGLRASNDALVAALLVAETLSHTFDEPTPAVARHGSACGLCPCVSRSGLEAGPYLLTLDYDPGCLPSSGLLPVSLLGHSDVSFSGSEATVSFPTLTWALEDLVTGSFGGPVTAPGDALEIEAGGAFAIGDADFDADLAIAVDGAGVAVDGDVRTGRGTVVLRDVVLPFDGITAGCPTPDAGTATLRDPDADVTVRFDRPGGGRVTVARDERVSEAVEWCGYRSDLL